MRTFLVGILMIMAGLFSAPLIAHAEGGLESEKGGLFHRKGWISPEIYRKAPSALKKKLANGRSNLGARVARPKPLARKARSTRKRTRKARGRIKRRIPTRIVRNRERKLTKASRFRPKRSRQRRLRVASLGKTLALPRATKTKKTKSITGGGARVRWVARSGCVPGRLKAAINYVARNFGRVRVNSTCRSRRGNRRVGGARKSWHLRSRAADIRVFGNIRRAARYLRRVVGGYKHYGGGLFHIDTGPRRSW